MQFSRRAVLLICSPTVTFQINKSSQTESFLLQIETFLAGQSHKHGTEVKYQTAQEKQTCAETFVLLNTKKLHSSSGTLSKLLALSSPFAQAGKIRSIKPQLLQPSVYKPGLEIPRVLKSSEHSFIYT